MDGQKLQSSRSSFIRKACPSLLNLSFVIVLEIRIRPHFSYDLLFDIRSVRRVPKTMLRQVPWKKFNSSSSTFQSTYISEPYMTTAITLPSNVLILIYRLMFPFFRTFFTWEKSSFWTFHLFLHLHWIHHLSWQYYLGK